MRKIDYIKNMKNRTKYLKEWYLKNKIRILKRNKKRYNIKKQEILKRQKKYYKIHKEEHNKFMREYYKKHKIYYKEKTYRYRKNLNFRLKDYLRNRIWQVLKNNRKSAKTIELLGCSIENLKQYLQKQFTKGMTWDNYGKWHIDHIKPCAKFDLSKEPEQCKCFNYTNLQPLWAKDNLSKGARYD